MSSEHSHFHVVPAAINFKVFLALIGLTILTVITARINLGGPWNIVLALSIACTKAILVFLWFMHLKYSHAINRVVIGSALFFLIVFLGLTATDVFFR
ncbi:MAG: cytochrome C oxidase subunit IV family protein [Bdellovibrio sp.]|nr:cytochrome C oxidase subunit IV family protein [Bdellovibrio sp.]